MSTPSTPPPAGPAATPVAAAPCPEFFERLAPDELIARYRSAIERLDRRVLDLPDAELDRWPDPAEGVGQWSCRALLTHLMDVEILYAMRLRRVIAEDGPVFENWDEHAFLDSPLCRPGPGSVLMPAGACLAVIHTLRHTTAAVLVQLDEAGWARRGLNPYLGEVSLARMLAHLTWHLEHHGSFLKAKIDAVLGPAPAEDPGRAAGGGCGQGCACAQGQPG